MFTMDSLVFLAIAVAILFAAVQRGGDGARTMSEKTHRAICGAAIAAGVLVRLARLTSLPAGISAEEALVGVQAKALWQTGGFLFGQGLTTQLSQWAGETTGPLLAVLTAPFVGLVGTVWGIKTAFEQIAIAQDTSLAVVAPGIAEALLATALGLMAAIPAVIFYNKFTADADRLGANYENFADEFSTILSRQLNEG